VFLDLNEINVQDPEGRLYQAMLDIAERKLDKLGLAALLRELATSKS
jgi:death on curing protein